MEILTLDAERNVKEHFYKCRIASPFLASGGVGEGETARAAGPMS